MRIRPLFSIAFIACGLACGSAPRPGSRELDAGGRVEARPRIDAGPRADAGLAPARDGSGPPPVAGKDGSSGDAGSNGEVVTTDAGFVQTSCADADAPTMLGLASAELRAPGPLSFVTGPQLTGDGLALTLMPQQNVTAGLRWYEGGLFMLADSGFWDIPGGGPPRWYDTGAVLLMGMRAGDVDGDGDQDALVMTIDANVAPDAGSNPFLTRLSIWERTPAGLRERAEVLRLPGMSLPIPFVFGDPDGDHDLDVISYERGAPVVYVNDGALHFERSVRGETAPAHADELLGWVEYADRNGDGFSDLLVLTGQALDLEAFVLLGDARGRFGAPGPSASFMPGLVPHGPSGTGLGLADVTGDGLSDLLVQDPSAPTDAPALLLRASSGALEFAAPLPLPVLGIAFADVDRDGTSDIVSTQGNRLVTLLARGQGKFETRDTGLRMSNPPVKTYAVDPQRGVVHILYSAPSCPSCGSPGSSGLPLDCP